MVYNFPDMSRSDLGEVKKSVDFAFTDFSEPMARLTKLVRTLANVFSLV